jgi:RNA recognition motif-containing protein
MTNLYIGNLPFTITENAVRDRRSPHGTIEKRSLITDRETGRPRGLGLIEMSHADATRAMQALDGKELTVAHSGLTRRRPASADGRRCRSNPQAGEPSGSTAKAALDVVASSLEKPMRQRALFPQARSQYPRAGDELLTDFRRRLELDEEARVERKRVDIAEQTLEPNVPGVRIRAWEKVHALRMPSSPGHPVLILIAGATQLSLAAVHEEQRVRSGRAATVV